MQGENRKLVAEGLVALNEVRRPGIAALMNVSGLQPGKLSAESIGFGLGPRINAAGRLAHAYDAAKLLTTTNHRTAQELAQRLESLNRERRTLTARLTERAEALVDPTAPMIIAADSGFESGVVGLVASRLAETYYRPAIIMEQGEEESRGSCRSIPEFHITHALDQVADLLVRHGGHAQAAGFTIRNEHLPEFQERMLAIAAAELEGQDLHPALEVDAEVSLNDVDWALQSTLSQLEPTGNSNPSPRLLSRNLQVLSHRTVGRDSSHLQLVVAGSNGSEDSSPAPLPAIAFRQGAWAGEMPDQVDAIYTVGVNEWQGRSKLQLMIEDIRPAGQNGRPSVVSRWKLPDAPSILKPTHKRGISMKVLVTGAAGFIGGHLAERLAQRGDEVIGLDNFNDYYDPARKRATAERLSRFPNFQMVEADIRDRDRMLELFAVERFDAVAHLAAMAGVRNAVANPDLYVQVDLNGTQNLLDAARAAGGVGNFVFASTSSVYGNTKQIPFVETDPCDRPLQPYAAAKRGAEILAYSYYHLFKQNVTVLRFFTVYGPFGRPDMMAYLLADSVSKGREIPLYDGGEMYRDWTFVDDIVSGIVAALDRQLGYEIINLGRGEPVLLSEFVEVIEALSGKKANVVNTPRLSADFVRNEADISKARRLLDYNPQVSVAEGVRRFWEWYQTYEINSD